VADSKTRLIFVVILVVAGLVLFAGVQTARLWTRTEVRRVEMERDSVRIERDSILLITALRDSVRAEVRRAVDSMIGTTDALRRRVDSMENARARAQLEVRLLRTNDAVEQRVRQTFPEFANAMRVTVDHTDPELPIEYIGFPVRFAEAFVIYRQNAESFEEQRDSLQMLDSLNVEVLALKDSIITLTELNERTFRVGYDTMYARYEARTDEYIRLLNQPRFKLDVPAVTALVGSMAAGVLVGTLIN
jgi:hypothetical protein